LRRQEVFSHWVPVAENDAPLPILQAVALAGTESAVLRLAINLAAHVLQIHGEGKVS
jgi:hypothetical protein